MLLDMVNLLFNNVIDILLSFFIKLDEKSFVF